MKALSTDRCRDQCSLLSTKDLENENAEQCHAKAGTFVPTNVSVVCMQSQPEQPSDDQLVAG